MAGTVAATAVAETVTGTETVTETVTVAVTAAVTNTVTAAVTITNCSCNDCKSVNETKTDLSPTLNQSGGARTNIYAHN